MRYIAGKGTSEHVSYILGLRVITRIAHKYPPPPTHTLKFNL